MVGVIADITAIGPLDHRDTGIMADRDQAYRHAGEQLAHDAAMTERIDRDFGRIQPGRRNNAGERPVVFGLAPALRRMPCRECLRPWGLGMAWTTVALWLVLIGLIAIVPCGCIMTRPPKRDALPGAE